MITISFEMMELTMIMIMAEERITRAILKRILKLIKALISSSLFIKMSQ